MLAISGLHLTLIAGSIYYLLIFLNVRQRLSAAAAFLTAAFYAVLCGWGVPIQRAFLMAGVIFMGIILEREIHMLNLFFFALFMTLIQDPLRLTSISFQMSFLSVFSLIWLLPRLGAFKNSRYGLLTNTTAVILVGTFPVIIYYFHTFSLISLPANLTVIPLFHGVLLSGLLSLIFSPFPFPSDLLMLFCTFLLNITLRVVTWMASISHSFLYVQPPSILKLSFYYGFMLIFLGMQKREDVIKDYLKFFFLTGWIISAVLIFVPGPGSGFELIFFAGGNHTLAYVRFAPDEKWLINTGSAAQGRQARWLLVPFFKAQGVNQFSGIVLSGLQKKHIGGLKEISEHVSFKQLFFPVSKNNRLSSDDFRKTGMHPVIGERQIAGKDAASIEAVGRVNGELILNIRHKNHNFLILPGLSLDVFEQVRKIKERLGHLEILYVPARQNDFEIFDGKTRLSEQLRPHAVIFYDCKKNSQAPLPYVPLCLSGTGAITYTSGKIGSRDVLKASSFLKGELLTCSL